MPKKKMKWFDAREVRHILILVTLIILHLTNCIQI